MSNVLDNVTATPFLTRPFRSLPNRTRDLGASVPFYPFPPNETAQINLNIAVPSCGYAGLEHLVPLLPRRKIVALILRNPASDSVVPSLKQRKKVRYLYGARCKFVNISPMQISLTI